MSVGDDLAPMPLPASPSVSSSGASSDDGGTAYPYHPTRLDPVLYQAVLWPTMELSRQHQTAPHVPPTLVWQARQLSDDKLSVYLNKVRSRCPFEVSEAAALHHLQQHEYDVERAVDALPYDEPETSARNFQWGDIWMRKVIECGANLDELSRGLHALEHADEGEVDDMLVDRCRQLQDEAVDFEAQFKQAVADGGRLRKLVRSYGETGTIDTPMFQKGCGAIHAAMALKRRMGSPVDSSQSPVEGQPMSKDEAVRWLSLMQQRAPFVSVPQQEVLAKAAQQTDSRAHTAARENFPGKPETPLSLTPAEPFGEECPSPALEQWQEAIRRKGTSRFTLAELAEFGDKLGPNMKERCREVIMGIQEERMRLRSEIQSRGNALNLQDCERFIQTCDERFCCVTPEEAALRKIVHDTKAILEKLLAVHLQYKSGSFIDAQAIESFCQQLTAVNIARVVWTGSESSCAVTWLRNVYQFIVSSRERVRSLKTRQEAIELLARLKAARIRVPDVEQVCSMHMGGILEAVALPGQPSPEDVAFDKQRRELADLLKSKPSTGKLQLFLQSMDRRPCAERSEAEARLQAGLQWIQESLAVLDGSQNDPEIAKQIATGKKLPVDVTQIMARLQTKSWENRWLTSVVAADDLAEQTRLYRQAQSKCSPRIANTLNILGQHLKTCYTWINSVRAAMVSAFGAAEGYQILGGKSITDISPAECVCRRRSPNAERTKCTQCSLLFHLPCTGLTDRVDSFVCIRCSVGQGRPYVGRYPPRVDRLGPRGPQLTALLHLQKSAPPNLKSNERSMFDAFIERGVKWAMSVRASLANADVQRLQLLYFEGEQIRIEIGERTRLASRIHDMLDGKVSISDVAAHDAKLGSDVPVGVLKRSDSHISLSSSDSSSSSSTISAARHSSSAVRSIGTSSMVGVDPRTVV
ncbi:hypothetical protein PBRA_001292 [Plasmodiophora brassicae]|uniref:ELM2 domain-containing protein n=1 Tax=Plasmodiophora brassicae TaxID=37360 RepID=A0A0G4IWC6_PLABS|nr:hypothetical protein PBRA_001292 [Plasmodiophora brassicae]